MPRRALVLLAVIAALRVAATARAQSAPAVTTNEAEYTFAESLSFHLQAQAEAPIEDVVLRYVVGDSGVRNRRIPEFTPGPEITAVHAETLARGQIPPASPITYWWTITDAAGHTTETEPQTIRYLDRRFDWQSTAGDDVRVWWYDADEAFAQDVAERARRALDHIEDTIGFGPDRRIEIVAYQSQADMRPALYARGDVYESRLATLGARVAPDILLLDAESGGDMLDEVLTHELSHVVLHLHVAEEYLEAPLWLDEGLAMYLEGPLTGNEQQALARAIQRDELMSVRSLTTFPGQADLVSQAYGQSRDLVAFLIEQHGQPAFRELVTLLGGGTVTVDEALTRVYGTDQTALYQAYRAARGLKPAATPNPDEPPLRGARRPAAGSTAGPCGGLAVLVPLLAAAWVHRRRGAETDASAPAG
jgi:hypothetical protein